MRNPTITTGPNRTDAGTTRRRFAVPATSCARRRLIRNVPHTSPLTNMNNDKRVFALLSLGLLVTALLVPFIIAAFGREDLALGFCIVAALLALLFGSLSWSERIGRTVTIALLCLLVVGGAGMAMVSKVGAQYMRAEEARARASLERTMAEGARQQ
jgi:hypothetical protein